MSSSHLWESAVLSVEGSATLLRSAEVSDTGAGSDAGCLTPAVRIVVVLFALFLCSTSASAQVASPTPITFADAIKQAQERNTTLRAAATVILRAEALIQQARAATRFQLTGNVTSTTLNTGVEFEGTTVTPQSQLAATLTAAQPILAAAAWARRAQADDARNVAELSVADIRRQIAFATADAFLTVIAQRRVMQGTVRARDVAKAHLDLATELERGGTGSRLSVLRAEQQYETNQGLLESTLVALYRAQEALGVLILAPGPADAADEPEFKVIGADEFGRIQGPSVRRTDLQLFTAEKDAAARIVTDSRKDWWPTVDLLFQPSTTYPSQFFLPQNSWRILAQANIPIFDSGQRTAVRRERQVEFERRELILQGAMFTANSEIRAAYNATVGYERSLGNARTAAARAQQVVEITNVSFRAGAATNIEVIDAERSARDADLAVAMAEDQLRRARLELLNAVGQFP